MNIYASVIPEEQHTAVGKQTGETAHVERWKNTLRQRLARFVRMTLSFSKSELMLRPPVCFSFSIVTIPSGSSCSSEPLPVSQEESKQLSQQPALLLQSVDPALREQVRWLGTAMLDFFEHIWTQAKNKGLPADIWQAWEDYMSKMLNETRLRFLWQTERSYYAPGFRRFMDTKIALPAEEELVSSLPRPPSDQPGASEPHQPHVARVIRAVAENNTF